MSYVRQPVLPSAISLNVERRSVIRIEEPFPALIRRRVDGNLMFTEEATVDNLSAYGLYLRLGHSVEVGDILFIVVRLSLDTTGQQPSPRVATRGVVLRAEPQADGRCGVAVMFTRHRFLFTSGT